MRFGQMLGRGVRLEALDDISNRLCRGKPPHIDRVFAGQNRDIVQPVDDNMMFFGNDQRPRHGIEGNLAHAQIVVLIA